jgi:hypothetical protein
MPPGSARGLDGTGAQVVLGRPRPPALGFSSEPAAVARPDGGAAPSECAPSSRRDPSVSGPCEGAECGQDHQGEDGQCDQGRDSQHDESGTRSSHRRMAFPYPDLHRSCPSGEGAVVSALLGQGEACDQPLDDGRGRLRAAPPKPVVASLQPYVGHRTGNRRRRRLKLFGRAESIARP